MVNMVLPSLFVGLFLGILAGMLIEDAWDIIKLKYKKRIKKLKKIMKTLKLSEDKALELYKTGSNDLKQILEDSFGKEFFKPKSIIDKIQTIEDVFEELGENYNDYIPPFPKAKTKEEKACNAQMLLFKIAKAYNEETILDWKNSNQYKYLNYKYFSGDSWLVCSTYWYGTCYCSAGLFYKSKITCDDSYNKFKYIYNDYWML